jgi:uncharacterized YccA/Bax inhibitor family protein
MRTSNPAFRNAVFTRTRALPGEGAMTLGGTVAKTFVLLALAIASTIYTWSQAQLTNGAMIGTLLLAGTLGGFVTALVLVFNPRLAPWLAPLYAVLEGLALGGISLVYQAQYRGLPMQAVGLTIATLAGMLVLYRAGVLRATDRFRAVVVSATLGIALFYLIALGLRFFGVDVPMLYSGGALGIGFSVLVSAVAALNLILDFDMIEQGVRARAPKFVEWYASFGLLVTLVWLYLELLRLLAKLQRRN